MLCHPSAPGSPLCLTNTKYKDWKLANAPTVTVLPFKPLPPFPSPLSPPKVMVAVSGLIKTLFASSAAKYTQEFDRLAAFGGHVGCDISTSASKINLSPINNAFQANFTPTFVGLAFGTQNYTCTQSNNFTYVQLYV